MTFNYEFTRLLVSNFKECFIFYRDILGFKPVFGTEDDVYAAFDSGCTQISLFDKFLMSKAIGTEHLAISASTQDKICLIFGVESVDITCIKLQEQGIQLVTPPTDRLDWGIRTAHFRDPDGNLIEINHPL
ncbi:MAG: VOC family protein [Anaerolineaceae bacterium]|jgi:catechol 2,3-dioxygenase-like lactoylglutathione lyase family enzyme|nr:VOC family protein [Anaerolineaceae bacterium]